MNRKLKKQVAKVLENTLYFGLAGVLLLASSLIGSSQDAYGSSHREAPLIARDPSADNTDTYAFVSPDRPDTVTIIGSWIPGELPQGGPYYYGFADDVVYELHVDNVGDVQGREIAVGQISGAVGTHANVPARVEEIVNGKATVLGEGFPVPPAHIGPKSTPDYQTLFQEAVQTIATDHGDIKVFAGQTDDPFWVDLGSIFDLLSLRPQATPVGYDSGPSEGVDGLAGFNVHSIAIQIPIERLLDQASDNTVLGVWATSSRPTVRVFGAGNIQNVGDLVQISRLGMPLVNEVVLPLALKDAFNSLKPEQDYDVYTSDTRAGELLASSVYTPEVGTLLNALYGVPLPAKLRDDLVAIFFTGMVTTKDFTLVTPNGEVTVPAGTNVNRPSIVRPAEMIRLNVAEQFRPGVAGSLCSPEPNYKLGLLGGDACGFPNGRRLQDDVTDIELLAVAGAAYSVLTADTFEFSADLIPVLNDGLDTNDVPFQHAFPYLAMPHQGYEFRSSGSE
ncbi:MAG: hypothetical protein DCC57_17875 [Chloroflexi bacterium]|nr:MAG: hypothetical protein DCC57_17875 [Chloroflexota bacterium]